MFEQRFIVLRLKDAHSSNYYTFPGRVAYVKGCSSQTCDKAGYPHLWKPPHDVYAILKDGPDFEAFFTARFPVPISRLLTTADTLASKKRFPKDVPKEFPMMCHHGFFYACCTQKGHRKKKKQSQAPEVSNPTVLNYVPWTLHYVPMFGWLKILKLAACWRSQGQVRFKLVVESQVMIKSSLIQRKSPLYKWRLYWENQSNLDMFIEKNPIRVTSCCKTRIMSLKLKWTMLSSFAGWPGGAVHGNF